MQTKLLTLALLLMGVSAGAQEPISVSISQDCSQNGKVLGLEAVDLGLSVKWATMNVGATAPEDYGYYFAWGETSEKSDYSWRNYKYCKGTYDTMTKYCKSSSDGTVDNKTILETEDDAAHVNLGGTWRMPTDAEWTELHEQCTWEWTTQNNVNGYLVTSKKAGYTTQSIFLPAAGCRSGTGLDAVGSRGYFWSSSLYEDGSRRACSVSFSSSSVSRSNYRLRYFGQSVRPVCPNTSNATTLTLYADGCDAPNTFTCDAGQQLSVSATPMEHRHFVKWSDGNTDNPRLVTMNQNLTYTATFENDFTIQVGCQNGKVTGANSYYKPNDEVVLTAVPDFGYHFVQWADKNTENPRTVIVTQDTVFYAEIAKDYEGKCGDNLSWQYTNNTLTITGTGAMYDYTSSTMPWKLFCDSITKIIFENGITSIGENAFVGCTNVGHVYCAANVPPKCPDNAFESMGQFSTILHVSANSVDMYKIALGWRFFFNILGDYDNTALEDMLLNNQNTSKFFQNGELYILRDGIMYDARGVRIE